MKYHSLTKATDLTGYEIFLPQAPNMEHLFAHFECSACHRTPWVEICPHDETCRDVFGDIVGLRKEMIDLDIDWTCGWCKSDHEKRCRELGVTP